MMRFVVFVGLMVFVEDLGKKHLVAGEPATKINEYKSRVEANFIIRCPLSPPHRVIFTFDHDGRTIRNDTTRMFFFSSYFLIKLQFFRLLKLILLRVHWDLFVMCAFIAILQATRSLSANNCRLVYMLPFFFCCLLQK